MLIVARPLASDHPAFYARYIEAAVGGDLSEALHHATQALRETCNLFPLDRFDHRYAPEKWTVKEVLVHLIDSERVFAYRALRFARNDGTPLPGFEQDDYVPESRAGARTIASILREQDAVREATLTLFASFDEQAMARTGTANGNRVSVAALGWIIAGHAMHHIHILRERYLH
ncbi:MAG TPA: DinB family protein [Flavobacteriales bacterium]